MNTVKTILKISGKDFRTLKSNLKRMHKKKVRKILNKIMTLSLFAFQMSLNGAGEGGGGEFPSNE